MKHISKAKGNGAIYIETLINWAKLLILCFPNAEMKRRLPLSSNKPSTLTGFLKKSSWIKAAPTMRGWKIITAC